MAGLSALGKARASELRTEPFPHLVVRDALPEDLCSALIAEFPPLAVVAQGKAPASNERFSYSAGDSLDDPRVSPLWRSFVAAHVGGEFWREVVGVFGEQFRRLYPTLERSLGPLGSWRTGIRNRTPRGEADLLLEGQICVNAPVTGSPSPCRGSHVDTPRKLFAGLLYLRHPDDDSAGSDLVLYRAKDKGLNSAQLEVPEAQLEPVVTVPFARNTLVFLPNSPVAFHGTTVRSSTPHARLFFNIVGEIPRPLFEGAGPAAKRLA